MNRCLTLLITALALCLTASAHADILASWSFETNTPADITNSATGPSVTAETGSGTLTGSHTDALSDWTTPTGNGSANALSVANWGTTGDTTGNYFQFSTDSTSYQDIVVSFHMASSNLGPRDFKLQYSTDGSTFVDSSSFTVLSHGSSAWNETTVQSQFAYSFNLSAVTALNDDASIYFRLVQTSTTSANSGSVTTGGNSRIDNVVISATAIPEPATLGLLGLGTLCLIPRRR